MTIVATLKRDTLTAFKSVALKGNTPHDDIPSGSAPKRDAAKRRHFESVILRGGTPEGQNQSQLFNSLDETRESDFLNNTAIRESEQTANES